MQVGHDSVIVGATLGLVSTAVPDEIATLAGKVLVGVLIALLSGMAHSAGKAIWHKLFPKKNKAEGDPPSPGGMLN